MLLRIVCHCLIGNVTFVDIEFTGYNGIIKFSIYIGSSINN